MPTNPYLHGDPTWHEPTLGPRQSLNFKHKITSEIMPAFQSIRRNPYRIEHVSLKGDDFIKYMSTSSLARYIALLI